MENIVEIKKLSKVYKTGEQEFKALDNIDLQIEKGKTYFDIYLDSDNKSLIFKVHEDGNER